MANFSSTEPASAFKPRRFYRLPVQQTKMNSLQSNCRLNTFSRLEKYPQEETSQRRAMEHSSPFPGLCLTSSRYTTGVRLCFFRSSTGLWSYPEDHDLCHSARKCWLRVEACYKILYLSEPKVTIEFIYTDISLWVLVPHSETLEDS